jgi:hypothetical protein
MNVEHSPYLCDKMLNIRAIPSIVARIISQYMLSLFRIF